MVQDAPYFGHESANDDEVRDGDAKAFQRDGKVESVLQPVSVSRAYPERNGVTQVETHSRARPGYVRLLRLEKLAARWGAIAAHRVKR